MVSPFHLNTTVPVVGGSIPYVFNDVNKSSALTEADMIDYINNVYSGNLDYKRTLDLLQAEQAFNASEAQKSRDWQKMMSDTSYQRAVADLKNAGYNPALVVGMGGASSPSGATAFSTSKQAPQAGYQMTSIINNLISSSFQLLGRLGSTAMMSK